MAITRDGDSAATTMNLLKNCDNFGYEKAEAQHYLEQTMQTISTGWEHALAQCGLAQDLLQTISFVWLND